MSVLTNQQVNYVKNRQEQPVCLAFATLTIRTVNLVRGLSEPIAENIRTRVTNTTFRYASLFLNHLTVIETEHGFRISFWCRSGTRFASPSPVTKNCAEVAVIEYTKRVLIEVQLQGNNVAQTEVKCMTDLSPCPDCTRNIPFLRRKLEDQFRDIRFSYEEAFVFRYQAFNELSREEKKQFKSKEFWKTLKRWA